jgi:hypothetical protein
MKVPALCALLLAVAVAPAVAEVETGAEAPEVEAKEYINIEPVTLSQLQGRLVFLELWKTT